GVWLPAALREPAAGAALAWSAVRAGRGTPAERSAVIACLCASSATPPSGVLDRLLADLPRWDAARPWLAAELARRDRDAGIAALRALMLAREAPPALRRSAAERLHDLDGEAARDAFVQAAEDDPVPSPGVRAMAPPFEPGGSFGDPVLRRLAEHAVPGAAAALLGRDGAEGLLDALVDGLPTREFLPVARRLHPRHPATAARLRTIATGRHEDLPTRLAAARILDRPDVWTLLSRDRRVMKRARHEVSRGLAGERAGVPPLPVPPAPLVRFLRFLAGRASWAVAAARRGVASLYGRVPEALRFRRRRFGRTPSPPAVEAVAFPEPPASPADLLAACERLLESIDEQDEAAFRALDDAVRRSRDGLGR
ncbi:MAG TPA: hypothetical protein VFV01_28140, partial [Spirillospora sp.]|nr:hypothetical protein [Spirillospora sp.]